MSRVEFTPDWPPGTGKVIVDGHDISDGVRMAALRSRAGDRPELILDVAVDEVPRINAEDAEIIIATGTRDALVKLGWTPPPEG